MAAPRVQGARRWNALLQQAREPVFLLDAQRRLALVNKAWEELTARRAEEVAGLECLPHGPTRDGDLAGLGASFCPPPEVLAGRPAGATTLIVREGGERLWRRVEFWPYHDARGGLIGIFGLVRANDAPPHAPESESHRLRAGLQELRDRLLRQHGTDQLIGQGPAHQRLMEQVGAAARTAVPVLILGEPGTGRKLVARTIHAQGTHPQAPLLPF